MNNFFLKRCFFGAVKKNYVFIVDIFLKFRININQKDENEMNAICIAAKENNKRMVKLLLKRGANINSFDRGGNTPIMFATLNDNKSMVELLLRKGANVNMTDSMGVSPLIRACRLKKYDIVSKLMEKSDLTIKTIDGVTALHEACKAGNETIVQEMLTVGEAKKYIDDIINVRDRGGNTPLMLASRIDENICKMLLDKGADATIKNNLGQTSLMMACESGQEEVVNTLINNAKVNIDDCDKKGETSLMIACKLDRPKIYKALLQKGADINLLNDKKQTSLMIASIHGNVGAVRELLLNKKLKRVNSKDENGKTALDYAQEFEEKNLENQKEPRIDGYEGAYIAKMITEWEKRQPKLKDVSDEFKIEPQIKEQKIEDLNKDLSKLVDLSKELENLQKKEIKKVFKKELKKLKKLVNDDSNVQLQSPRGLVLGKSKPNVSLKLDTDKVKMEVSLPKVSVEKELKKINISNQHNIPGTSNDGKF